MEDKVINSRISEIFNLFSQLIVMQIQALYDEYEETELYEIEKDYHEKYKNLINKSTKDLDIYCKIKEFIFSEVDYYGLDTRENDIKSDIENFFYDFSKNLSVESMIMRDEWKKKHVGELEENILLLNETIKNLRENHQILERDFEIIKRKSEDLSKEIDTYLQKNEKLSFENGNLNVEIQDLKNQNKKLSFENRNLNVEIQDLKNQNNNLEFEKNNLKSEVLSLKDSRKKERDIERAKESKKLKVEIEHLKNGINLLQSQVKEKESSKLKVCDEKNKLLNEYNKVLSKNNDMEKEIQKLKTEMIKLSKDSKIIKISLKEAKSQFDEMYKEIFEELKIIVSKTIQGHNLRDYANTINKKRASFKYLESSDDMSELLLDFIIQLSKLHNLLERNSKESNLGQYIKELKELKDKI